ncbi:SGNH/GDSL hydrolase family protein [Kitasatospora sp. NPDC088351]|uniref:golvesin C-terminal-like domain-containing protein n=1 Tax=Kitasatospora sp. NPDC088351 TaxID=3155180 RepID=UPI0034391B32
MVHRPRKAVIAAAFTLLAGITVAAPATAAPDAPTPQQQTPAFADPPRTPSKVTDPDTSLPPGWRGSDDRAVTLAGDGGGLHVLAAESGQAYQWRTVATLSEPGFNTDLWIGNSCVTGSGQRAVVVYAPRQFVNKPELLQRGGFAAVVDLASGAVTKLPETVSLAYFDPGCGVDETAVLTQNGDSDLGSTRLLTVDTAAGTIVKTVTVKGQVTSAVPTRDGLVGASGAKLSRIDDSGNATELETTSGAASSVHPDTDGGIAFIDHADGRAAVKRLADGKVSTLAQAPTGEVALQPGAGGKLFVTGKPEQVVPLPGAVTTLPVPVDAVVSTKGAIAVDQSVSGSARGLAAHPLQAPEEGAPSGIEVKAEVPATGKKLTFSVAPDAAAGGKGAAGSPALESGAAAPAGTGKQPKALAAPAVGEGNNAYDPVDEDRTCSVPRNDPAQQAYQPTPNQVEWAVDMAVRGQLTGSWVRQGGWRTETGLGFVDPQAMFPLPALTGAPSAHIPPQVLLGVLAQESNLWQAEGGAMPGQTGNPLTGGFYGHPKADPAHPQDVWQIKWDKVDCGYGIGQQTDGMHGPTGLRTGDVVWPYDKQKAVGLDYTSNIAAAARTLAEKWNELHDPTLPASMKINDDDPSAIENWFTAAWNYNSGFNKYDPATPLTRWGLGYLNNPANPIYQPDRKPFLDGNHYADAAHPQYWPYQEKVLGWAAWPIDTGRSYDDNGNQNKGNTAGYSAAWWTNEFQKSGVKPPLEAFCNTNNSCDPKNPPRCEIDHLGPSCDPPYWYHGPASWKTCSDGSCGHEYLTYKTLRAEPGNGNSGAPNCAAPPSGSLVIDSVSGQVPPMRDGCTRTWTNAGTLSFNFQADSAGHYEAKADLHQIGGGYGAHFWYAHTRSSATSVSPSTTSLEAPPNPYGTMAITGTWQLNQRTKGWTRVFVHVPDTGSQTQQAIYTVHTGNGVTRNRILNVVSNSNHWVSLGVFEFVDGSDFQGVQLSNYTPDGDAVEDVAWDAAAFQPLPGKPKDVVVQMGDSYSSGEGAQPYIYGTDMGPYADIDSQTSPGRSWNACRRSVNSWVRQTVLPGRPAGIGSMADSLDTSLDYHSVACSGAYTWQMDTIGSRNWGTLGQHHEVTQLDSGFLDENTTLVVLNAGGNDSGFASTVKNCALLSCPSDAKVKGDIDNTAAPLKDLIKHINEKAPKAKIILLGYPKLFDVAGVITSVCSVMNEGAAMSLNKWADYMKDSQQKAVDELRSGDNPLPVTFYSPMVEFEHRGVCGSVPGINDLVAAPTTKGGGDFSCPGSALPCPSMESYHPNNSGTKQYALALTNALKAAGY